MSADNDFVCDEYSGECYETGSISRFASLDYYRDKIREFQVTLNELAKTKESLSTLATLPLPPAEAAEIVEWFTQYEEKRGTVLATAEAVNMASQAANAIGVRMPVLSIPQTLNAPPLMIAGIAAAVATAAALTAWAIDRIADARAIANRIALIDALTPDERAEAVKREQEIALAQANALNPVSAVANAIKWVAVGVAALFAYRAWREFSER